MFYRPLVLLSCLSLIASTSAHIIQPAHLAIRQNEPEASPSIDPDTGAEASPSPEAEASVSPSPDSAASAETPEQSTDVGPAVSSQDILAGAGTGGQVPVACFSCEDVYSDVVSCNNQGSSDHCSPLCMNYAKMVSCLSCLVQNGQPGVDQQSAQQVVWNVEAACSDIGAPIAQTREVTAQATATGPFTTPAVTATAPSTARASTSHSGLTLHQEDTTRMPKQTGSIQTVQAATPTTTGGASSKPGPAVAVLGAAVFGALII